MGMVIKVEPGATGLFRSVVLGMYRSELRRPVNKLPAEERMDTADEGEVADKYK